jgi:hypothetical protein
MVQFLGKGADEWHLLFANDFFFDKYNVIFINLVSALLFFSFQKKYFCLYKTQVQFWNAISTFY